jgi:hypothetical protein
MSEHGEHIDVEVLSDLVEGLLPPEREAELAAHLAGCAECRDTQDALAQIRELLGDQPVEPMPADVVARIDGALALAALPPPRPAEAPRPVVPTARDHDAPSGTVSLDAARRRRRRRGPLLLAAAAAVAAVVIGVTVIGGGGDDDRKHSADRSAGAPAAAPSPSASPKPAERPGAGPAQDSPQAPNAAAPHAYSDAGLPEQITRLLGARPTDLHSLPACVSTALGPKAAGALAVDAGTYRGKSAYVVVLAGGDPARVRVYIVDASCASDATTTSGTPERVTIPETPPAAIVLLDTEVARG